MDFDKSTLELIAVLAGAAWTVSEYLGLTAKFQANGLLHALLLVVKKLAGK